eukprot:m.227723 g.227723  ORF g.227723 m.227723 type:complete len:64 (+) comp40041_c0_seq5:1599-1790(+)
MNRLHLDVDWSLLPSELIKPGHPGWYPYVHECEEGPGFIPIRPVAILQSPKTPSQTKVKSSPL